MLCQVLFDHRVLTTGQIVDLCFENMTTARHRLSELYRIGVLDRFRHFRPVGSDPYHYVLNGLGTEVVAADRGIDVARPGLHHTRALALADSQRLGHLLGTNGVFCSLTRWARSESDAELAEWWSERRCGAEWGEVVRPDGFGVLRQGSTVAKLTVVEFFLEYDGGTETVGRLAAKLAGYADLVHATGWSPLVCFWFPSPHREAEARKVLVHPDLAVVTGAVGLADGSDGEAWLPVGSTLPRCRLIDLAAPVGSRS